MEQPVSNLSSSKRPPARKAGDVVQLRNADYQPAVFDRKWIPTKNDRNFGIMLDILGKGAGRGRLGMIVGPFGRGKTWMLRRHVAHDRNAIYLLCWEPWQTSELGLLQALCRELGMSQVPHRKDPCILQIVDRLISKPRTVFLDEADLIPKRLDLIRQIAEATAGAFVLAGENALADHMIQNGRTWSRTFQTLTMELLSMADVIYYAQAAAGLEVSEECAAILHASPGGGDWRNLERLTLELAEICNANRTRVVTTSMAELAVKLSLKGVAA